MINRDAKAMGATLQAEGGSSPLGPKVEVAARAPSLYPSPHLRRRRERLPERSPPFPKHFKSSMRMIKGCDSSTRKEEKMVTFKAERVDPEYWKRNRHLSHDGFTIAKIKLRPEQVKDIYVGSASASHTYNEVIKPQVLRQVPKCWHRGPRKYPNWPTFCDQVDEERACTDIEYCVWKPIQNAILLEDLEVGSFTVHETKLILASKTRNAFADVVYGLCVPAVRGSTKIRVEAGDADHSRRSQQCKNHMLKQICVRDEECIWQARKHRGPGYMASELRKASHTHRKNGPNIKILLERLKGRRIPTDLPEKLANIPETSQEESLHKWRQILMHCGIDEEIHLYKLREKGHTSSGTKEARTFLHVDGEVSGPIGSLGRAIKMYKGKTPDEKEIVEIVNLWVHIGTPSRNFETVDPTWLANTPLGMRINDDRFDGVSTVEVEYMAPRPSFLKEGDGSTSVELDATMFRTMSTMHGALNIPTRYIENDKNFEDFLASIAQDLKSYASVREMYNKLSRYSTEFRLALIS